MTARIMLICDADPGQDTACGAQLYAPAGSAFHARRWAAQRAGWTHRPVGDHIQDLCPKHGQADRLPLPPAGDAHG